MGSLTAGAFNAAGTLFPVGSHFTENVIAHAVVGCASAVIGDGSCRAGAYAGGFSAWATPGISGSLPAQVTQAAVIGGVGSVLGGGKFENGAVTGAFGYLFNHCGHVEGGCWRALKDAAGMAVDWAIGRGEGTRVFGPGSIQVVDMMDAPGINSARDFFYKKNAAALGTGLYDSLQPVTNYGASFGLSDLLTTSSPTQQFVGSYRIDIWPVNNGGDLMFVLNNNSSFKSFGYGIAPAWERSTFGPAGNMRQTYWWTEPRRP